MSSGLLYGADGMEAEEVMVMVMVMVLESLNGCERVLVADLQLQPLRQMMVHLAVAVVLVQRRHRWHGLLLLRHHCRHHHHHQLPARIQQTGRP